VAVRARTRAPIRTLTKLENLCSRAHRSELAAFESRMTVQTRTQS
jgi:hypothetical protein